MSCVSTPHMEPVRTLHQAAGDLGFPSVDALRMYLARHRGLIGERYRRSGRSFIRLLTASEVERIAELTIISGTPVKSKFTRTPP